ncbi:hypothetical protein ANN_14626 [Periplaneta americana]|uniref:DUF4817 domain-containing protein n=1 Tax=Periplaneta americana TaxID=6978 RepID=A0ABQ8SXX8_PERAM|nr:hypothetical protein ANN_14626 [Periplaneta americana]
MKKAAVTTEYVVRSLPSKETLRGHSDSSFRGEGYIQCCVGVRLRDMYSNQELAEIHFMYGKADGNAALARRLYQERYPQRQCPDRKTFVRLHYRLCEYGKFNSLGLGRGRSRSTTPEVQEEILEAVNMTTPSISTRRVALQVNVPHTTDCLETVERVSIVSLSFALSPADYPARVRFCQWFLQQCGVNPNFPALVLFTDEAQFTRDGITNFHNQHVWAYENPRATLLSHHQVRFSLNMWAGIIGDRLVGPHVLVNRLTGQAYTNFLENTIPHVLEDTPLINRQHIHFLHDGAPAHFSRTARRYLDRRFPDRWIGRGGPIAWPPRSPDLNPLDFYLWGHLKSLVYSSPVPDLESFGIELWHVLRTYAILLEFGIVFAATLAAAEVISASPDVPEFCPAGVLLHANNFESLERIEKVKARFLERALGAGKFAPNRYMYLLARETFFIEDLRMKMALPSNESYNEAIARRTTKQRGVDSIFFCTDAMIYRDWIKPNQPQRYAIVGLTIHGYHHKMCQNSRFHQTDEKCVCKFCVKKCELYHFSECRNRIGSLTDLIKDKI